MVELLITRTWVLQIQLAIGFWDILLTEESRLINICFVNHLSQLNVVDLSRLVMQHSWSFKYWFENCSLHNIDQRARRQMNCVFFGAGFDPSVLGVAVLLTKSEDVKTMSSLLHRIVIYRPAQFIAVENEGVGICTSCWGAP